MHREQTNTLKHDPICLFVWALRETHTERGRNKEGIEGETAGRGWERMEKGWIHRQKARTFAKRLIWGRTMQKSRRELRWLYVKRQSQWAFTACFVSLRPFRFSFPLCVSVLTAPVFRAPPKGPSDTLDVPFVTRLAGSDGLRQMLKLTFFQAIRFCCVTRRLWDDTVSRSTNHNQNFEALKAAACKCKSGVNKTAK